MDHGTQIKKNSRKKLLEHWQVVVICLILWDLLALHLSYFLALWVRFDCIYSRIPMDYLNVYLSFITAYAAGAAILFWLTGMYRSVWRYASYPELIKVFTGSTMASLLHIILITILFRRMPLSYYLWGAILQFMGLCLPRFSYRLVLFAGNSFQRPQEATGRVMIIGAGENGQMLLRDINHAKELNDKVVCFIDDNSNKWGRYIGRVPIVGGRDDILASVEKYCVTKIFLAIPSARAEAKRDIINICNETDCVIKQVPGLYQFALGTVSVSSLQDISVEDLLGREPIRSDLSEVYGFIHGKIVLVTGGGGSIGSELCRQVAAHQPKQLILFDVYENNTYEVQLELKKQYPDLNLVTLIGSVRDSRRMFEVFDEYRPQIVYHAAAHKHVPLMEDSPCEAIKNNAIGTYKTAYAAMVHGCERFVLISTDKAVNPTNIMGASKRLCEMIVQSFDQKIKEGKADEIPQMFTHVGVETADKDGTGNVFRNIHTEFVAVRFGNVLGSNGSVIPIFKRQIEAGGPVTVTHPDIIRFFMTIKEAVSLVMTAGTYAHGGEIFVLDMGSPMKIDTLARNLIRLSGLRPDIDVRIEYSGLRPGEKLYEETLMAEEGLEKTENELIYIGKPIPFDTDEFLGQLDELMMAAYSNKKDIRSRVMKVVGTYHPNQAGATMVKDQRYVTVDKAAYRDDIT